MEFARMSIWAGADSERISQLGIKSRGQRITDNQSLREMFLIEYSSKIRMCQNYSIGVLFLILF